MLDGRRLDVPTTMDATLGTIMLVLTQMSVGAFLVIFRRIYDHVQARYPGRAILLTQSTL